MDLRLPTIYPITDASLAGIPIFDQVKQLIDGGAELIQLRDKLSASNDLYDSAVSSVELAHKAGVRIIVNDRVDIAMMCGADGVHLGQNDLSPLNARKLMGENAIIGYSTHELGQVKAAMELPIDYIAFGPIYKTQTKVGQDPVVGLELLRQARQITQGLPLVAIGGLTAANIPKVFEAGADSAAVISELMSHADNLTTRMRRLGQLKPICKT